MCATRVEAQVYYVSSGMGVAKEKSVVYESGYVDIAPSFPGGERALIDYINETRRYPSRAFEKKVQGRVRCRFVVDVDGTINAISVIKGVEQSLDEEAVRIIREMPKWEAAILNGRPVPVYYVLAIPFRL